MHSCTGSNRAVSTCVTIRPRFLRSFFLLTRGQVKYDNVGMEIVRHRKMVWFRLSAFGVIGPLDLPPNTATIIQRREAELLVQGRKS